MWRGSWKSTGVTRGASPNPSRLGATARIFRAMWCGQQLPCKDIYIYIYIFFWGWFEDSVLFSPFFFLFFLYLFFFHMFYLFIPCNPCLYIQVILDLSRSHSHSLSLSLSLSSSCSQTQHRLFIFIEMELTLWWSLVPGPSQGPTVFLPKPCTLWLTSPTSWFLLMAFTSPSRWGRDVFYVWEGSWFHIMNDI